MSYIGQVSARAMQAADIGANAVITTKIADDNVTIAKMANDSVGADELASNAVVSASIVDGAIVNADVNASAALDATKLADGSVTSTELQYINSLSSNAQTQITNTVTVANAALPKAGGTMSGETIFADQLVTRPVIKDYGETKAAMAAHAVDLSLGNVQTYTLSGNQTLTFTNPPATGTAGSFTLILTNGGSATLTWPTSVDWAGGSAPGLTSSGIDVLTFTTIDGGTIWYGFLAGAAMA